MECNGPGSSENRSRPIRIVLAIALALAPFVAALIRFTQTGTDTGYFWVALGAFLGALTVMLIGRAGTQSKNVVFRLAAVAFLVSTLLAVLAARLLGAKAAFDGVLVNSAELVERTWRVWAARHHLDAEKVIAVAHGRRTVETVGILAPHLAVDAEVAALESSEMITSEGVYEIPGARELLEKLPSERWAVVTSGIRAVAEFRIRLTGLPMPSVMICAEDLSRGKPDPEGYLTAALRLGRASKDCIVIEDAPAGIEAAHNAGMRVIAIAATYPADQLSAADLVVERLIDLTAVWKPNYGVIELNGRPASIQ